MSLNLKVKKNTRDQSIYFEKTNLIYSGITIFVFVWNLNVVFIILNQVYLQLI